MVGNAKGKSTIAEIARFKKNLSRTSCQAIKVPKMVLITTTSTEHVRANRIAAIDSESVISPHIVESPSLNAFESSVAIGIRTKRDK
jgi:hypothetical protein